MKLILFLVIDVWNTGEGRVSPSMIELETVVSDHMGPKLQIYAS